MTIQSLGMQTAYGASSAQKSKTSGIDDEIQSLKSQKEMIQKRINKYKTDKDAESDTKQKLIKNLEDQITKVDAQIQEKEMERAKEQATKAAETSSDVDGQQTFQNNQTDIQQGLSRDAQMVISQMQTYNKAGKLVQMGKLSKTKADELASDAKVQAEAGDTTGTGKLYAESAKLLSQSDSQLASAAKYAAKINGSADGGKSKGSLSGISETRKEEDTKAEAMKQQKDKKSKNTDETAE